MNQKYLKRIVASYVREKDVPCLASVKTPEEVVRQFQYLESRDREEFISLHLDRANHPICWDRISMGTMTETILSNREILKTALLSSATSLIVIHNHPSGNVMPSAEDREITRRLIEAANLFQIKVLDHIILGSDSAFYSFREHGLI